MFLKPAVEADYAEIIDLVNLAFRGSGPSASWNVEAGIIEGQRLDESVLREDLTAKPTACLLTPLPQQSRDSHPPLLDIPHPRDAEPQKK